MSYLDCRERKTFTDLHTFSRNLEKTYFDSNGALQTAAVNEPAFDHDPVTGEALGLSVHEQRTNLLLHSEAFDNAYWKKANVSITPNDTTAPDGSLTADLVTTTTSSDSVEHTTSGASGVTYTASGFVKQKTVKSAAIALLDGFPTTVLNFDFATETLTLSEGTTTDYGFQKLPNGWYRLWVSETTDSTSGVTVRFASTDTNEVSSYYLWGAQIEQGSFPTPYIPTTTAQVTRQADVCLVDNIDQSDWWNPNEGTFVVEFEKPYYGVGAILALSLGAITPSRIEFFVDSDSKIGVATGGIASASSQVIATKNKLALKIDSSNVYFSLNGGAIVSHSLGTFLDYTQNRLKIGMAVNNSVQLNGTVKSIKYKPAAVSDTELQELSKL